MAAGPCAAGGRTRHGVERELGGAGHALGAPGRAVLELDPVHPGRELRHAPLLDHAEQARLHRLLGRRGHLEDLAARRALAVDVAAVDGLELHVVGHARVDEHLDQLAARHDELGHHVNGVVPQLAELRLTCGG